MNDVQNINLQLCRALGIADTSLIAKVQLTLEPGKPPQLLVHRILVNDSATKAADRIQDVVQRLQLSPVEAPVPEAIKSAP